MSLSLPRQASKVSLSKVTLTTTHTNANTSITACVRTTHPPWKRIGCHGYGRLDLQSRAASSSSSIDDTFDAMASIPCEGSHSHSTTDTTITTTPITCTRIRNMNDSHNVRNTIHRRVIMSWNSHHSKFFSSQSSSSSSTPTVASAATAASPIHEEEEHSRILQETKRLLDANQTPLGSFSISHADEVERYMNYWVQLAQQPSLSSSPSSSSSSTSSSATDSDMHQLVTQYAEYATQLFIRMVQEYAEGNPSARFPFSTHSVDAILSSWKNIPEPPNEPKHANETQNNHHHHPFPIKALQILQTIQSLLDGDYDAVPYKRFLYALSSVGTPRSAKTAQGLLDAMVQLDQKGKFSLDQHRPDAFCFHSVIRAWWLVSSSFNSTHHHHHHYNQDNNHDSHHSSSNSNLQLHRHRHRHPPISRNEAVEAAENALQLLNRMKGQYRLGNHQFRPNLKSFATTISALLMIDAQESGEPYHHNHYTPSSDYDDDTNTPHQQYHRYNAHNKDRDELYTYTYRAEEVLRDMIHFHRNDPDVESQSRPDKALFDTVLGALVRVGTLESSHRSIALLEDMEDLCRSELIQLDGGNDGNDNQARNSLWPDTLTYNFVIASILRSRRDDAAVLIEKLIGQMEDRTSSTNTNSNIHTYHSCSPDVATYNSLLKAYSQMGNARKAESILKSMLSNSNHDDDDDNDKAFYTVRPDTTSWNTVIEAHAKSTSPKGADEAERLLHELVAYRDAGNPDVGPDRVTISLLIGALSRKAKRGDTKAADGALAILQSMLQTSGVTHHSNHTDGDAFVKDAALVPDAITFTTVIDCLAKSRMKDSGIKAERLLRQMQTLMLSSDGKWREDIKPDTVTYNAVLSALSNGRSRQAASKAEELLNEMETSDDFDVRPNTVSYSTVISAWAKSGAPDAFENADRLLRTMEDARDAGSHAIAPNAVSYASVLDALSKSRNENSSKRAMDLLWRMEERYRRYHDLSVRPNVYTYASAMAAIANDSNHDSQNHSSTIADKAQDLLDHILHQSQTSENPPPDDTQTSPSSHPAEIVLPNTVVFNTAIRAVERSAAPDKAHRAERILKIMKHLHRTTGRRDVAPNVRTYNALIRACAFATTGTDSQKRASFDVAFRYLVELRGGGSTATASASDGTTDIVPDMYTYPAMFKACENLLGRSDPDFQLVRTVFEMCCRDGVVDGLVLKNLSNFLPRETMRDMLRRTETNSSSDGNKDDFGDDYRAVRLSDLPKQWYRKIHSRPHDGRKNANRKKQWKKRDPPQRQPKRHSKQQSQS